MVAGELLLALAGLIVLGQAARWLKTDYWISLSFPDALDLVDVAPSVWLTVHVGEIAWAGLQNVVWYAPAEAPLAGLLAADGGVLIGIGVAIRKKRVR